MHREWCRHRGARPTLWRESPGSAPLTPICPGQSSAKAAPSPTRSPSYRAVTVQPHQQHVLSRGFTQVPWSRPQPKTRGCSTLAPSPHPGRPCQGGHPAPRGRAGHVTSWAGATRNHPDPEPPGRLSSHQACQAEDDLPAPGGTAGRRALGSCPGSGPTTHARPWKQASGFKAPPQMLLSRVPQCSVVVGGRAPSQPTPGGPGPGPASSTQARTPREHPGGRAPAPATSRQSGPSWPLRHPAGPQAAVPHHQGTSPRLSWPRARGQQQLREQGTFPGGGRRSPATHPDETWARACPLEASTHLTGCRAIGCLPPCWA